MFFRTFVLQNCEYSLNAAGKRERLELVQVTLRDSIEYLDSSQKLILDNLEALKIASSNLMKARELFALADSDLSGEIDRNELRSLLEAMGFPTSEGDITDMMNQHSIDDEEKIEFNEFIKFLRSKHKEACEKISDLSECRVMALAQSQSIKYIPPRSGLVVCLL